VAACAFIYASGGSSSGPAPTFPEPAVEGTVTVTPLTEAKAAKATVSPESAIREILLSKYPGIGKERGAEIAGQIASLAASLELDPYLIFAVADVESESGTAAVDRRWKYDVKAIAEGRNPGEVVIPEVWDDLVQVAQSLKDDLNEFRSGGVEEALKAYFFGSSRLKIFQPLSITEKLLVQKALQRYREVVAISTGEAQIARGTAGAAPGALLLSLIQDDKSVGDIGSQQLKLERYTRVKEAYSRLIRFFNRKTSEDRANDLAERIIYYSAVHGIDSRLFFAVLAVESRFEPRAVSPKGAQGLGQLMPGTAKTLGVSDPFDPDENLRGAASHLADLLTRNSVENALAAYNAGEERVRQAGGIPPIRETRLYVRKVLNIYRQIGGTVAVTP
jgi:soluble lytic murein transglycosylase-like protein